MSHQLIVSKRIFFSWMLVILFTVVKGQTGDIEKYLRDANEGIEKQDYQKALLALKVVLTKDAANIRALESSTIVYDKLKNYKEASRISIELTELQPENSNYLTSAGWFLMLDKQYTESEKYLQQALVYNDCSFNIYLNLGHVYAFLKQKAKCEEFYKKAASYIPNKQAYENSILGDLAYFKTREDYPYNADTYKNMFTSFYTNQYLKKNFGSDILDTLYQLTTFQNYSIKDPAIIDLKHRFLTEELKNQQWRTYVLRDFFWSLGWLQFNTGSREIAIEKYFMNVVKISNDLKDTSFLIKTLYKVGIANTGGMPLVKQALDLAIRSNNINQQFNINLILGDNMLDILNPDSAIIYFRKNLSLVPGADEIPDAGGVALNRMMISFGHLKYIDSVTHYYNLLRKQYVTGELSEKSYTDDVNYCQLLQKSAMYPEAIISSKKFIVQYHNSKNIDISQLYEITGMAYYKTQRQDSAALYYKKAIKSFTEYANNNPDKDLNFPFKERLMSFIFLKRITLAEKDINAYFDLSEQSKGNILYDKLTRSKHAPESIDISVVAKDLSPDEVVISYTSSSMANSAAAILITKDSTLLVKEDHELLKKLVMSHTVVDWEELLNKFLVSAEKLSPSLSKEEVKSSIYLLGAVALSLNNRMTGTINSRGVSDDGEKNKNVKAEMAAYNDIMYNIYFRPFEKILKDKKTIYISTDLVTALIPFETLQNDEGKYLGEIYNFIYVPSLTSRAIIKRSAKQGNKNMLAIGNPDYSSFDPHSTTGRAYDLSRGGLGNWSNLPGTAKELQSIHKNIPLAVIMDKEKVTESSIKALSLSGELEKYEVLHFAVHGMASKDDYRDNAIILSEKNGSSDDGFLQFNEIANLRINANLVCLSACQTALGLPSEGEELKNLPVAFLLAGAKSVIATWWKIDDEATGIFMTSFYNQAFRQNKSYAEALHITRQKFIRGEFGEKYKDPYYWAAFKYFGY